MRLRRPFLIFTLLLAAVFGIVVGGAQSADTLRDHVVCAEHGDLVHMPEVTASASGTSELRALPDSDHTRCVLGEFAPAPSTELPAPPLVLPDLRVAFALDPPARALPPAQSSLPLLRCAPKTSPPV
ncbi:MAG: hypothetical protein Q8P41_17830 [Pseudomonadota bacterium]|nr:hypothetical protein [Pseudomonadota bacterium]